MKMCAWSAAWCLVAASFLQASVHGASAQSDDGGSTAGAAHDPLAQGSVAFDSKVPADLEVMRARTGHLLVRPTVNGHRGGWFIFDTGAGICVVSTPHAAELELTSAGNIQAVGVGGSENAGLYRASTVSLGRVSLRDHPLMTTDLSFLKAHLGEEIVGVIGYGVLSRCIAEVDLTTPKVALHDPATFELAKGEWTPMNLDTRIPAVPARFEDREGLFSLDTGANYSLAFNAAAVNEWKLLDGREVSDSQVGGVGGFVNTKKGTVEWFEFGGMRHERVTATFAIQSKGSDAETRRQGTIGAELLRPYILVTDYAKNRIAFLPRVAAIPAAAATK